MRSFNTLPSIRPLISVGIIASCGLLSSCSEFQEVKLSGSSKGNAAREAGKDGQRTGSGYDGSFNPDAKDVPQFALLANQLQCGMCHLKVHGDMISTSNAGGNFTANHQQEANEIIDGAWFIAGTWDEGLDYSLWPELLRANLGPYPIFAKDGIKANYAGPELPKDLNGDGEADFPMIDMLTLPGEVNGKLKHGDTLVTAQHTGNLVLVGTQESPIEVEGEVLIKGDLVIKGYYQGVGTIYVEGNIYIPFDLKATRSIFPLPEDKLEAALLAKDHVQNRLSDALGLATTKSIFIGNLDSSLYDHQVTPIGMKRENSEMEAIYSWYPNGKAGYESLYEAAYNCITGLYSVNKSFNMVEAYLYAANAIGGFSPLNAWVLNGGMIADSFQILGRAGSKAINRQACPDVTHPVHGQSMINNHIVFDERMKQGLELFQHFKKYFSTSTNE